MGFNSGFKGLNHNSCLNIVTSCANVVKITDNCRTGRQLVGTVTKVLGFSASLYHFVLRRGFFILQKSKPYRHQERLASELCLQPLQSTLGKAVIIFWFMVEDSAVNDWKLILKLFIDCMMLISRWLIPSLTEWLTHCLTVTDLLTFCPNKH